MAIYQGEVRAIMAFHPAVDPDTVSFYQLWSVSKTYWQQYADFDPKLSFVCQD